MARGNYVSLHGYVNSVNVFVDQNIAQASIVVARGTRPTGDAKQRTLDLIMIMTNKPEQVTEMATWQKYYVVEVWGVLAVISKARRAHVCKHCHETISVDGTSAYVYPKFVKLHTRFERGNGDVDDKGLETQCKLFLEEHKEVSNTALVFGRLCNDPKRKTLNKGLTLTEYQIAVNRLYRVTLDDSEAKTDFIWVKAYGSRGADDAKYLHQNSEICIDGFIQSRKVQQHAVCPLCGGSYDWELRVLEIVPYTSEYLGDFYNPEEAEQKEQEKIRQQAQSVLSTLKGATKKEDAFAGIDFGEGLSTEN